MTPRFSDEDLEKGSYIPLPKGKHPVMACDPVAEDENGVPFMDKDGRLYYRIPLEVIGGPNKGQRETWTISEFWMNHLIIHFMRSCGMMTDNNVDPFFRGDPKDNLSWDLNRLLNNVEGVRVMLTVDGYLLRKGPNAGSEKRTIDFSTLLGKDKKPVKQPKWIEPLKMYKVPDGEGAVAGGIDPELGPDLDLAEDEDFFAD